MDASPWMMAILVIVWTLLVIQAVVEFQERKTLAGLISVGLVTFFAGLMINMQAQLDLIAYEQYNLSGDEALQWAAIPNWLLLLLPMMGALIILTSIVIGLRPNRVRTWIERRSEHQDAKEPIPTAEPEDGDLDKS